MSWLNLNQSLSSLKGQITNFASEVLSESPGEDVGDGASQKDSTVVALEEKCHNQELEIASLKKLVKELQTTLQSERLTKRNGVKEEESSWYWDPPAQTSKGLDPDLDNQYKIQIRALQDEISTLKEKDTAEPRPTKQETNEELNKLKEENKNLTNNLEDLDNQHQLAMERLLSLKKELQNNFEVLKQEHEDLKNSNDDYSAEIKKLLVIIGDRDKEIEHLKTTKSDHDTLYHKYQNLERIHGLLRENAEKFQEENQDLHEEVFKLQEQVTKLEHDIEVATKHSEMSDFVPKKTYEELLKELNDLKDMRRSNQVHLDEVNIDDNAKSVIENLKREIHELKHKLNLKESDSKIIRPERVMQLYNKYVNFELPIDYVGEIPSAGDNIVFYKLESVFKTVNSFKKDIEVLEQKISEKNHNENHLKTQIDDITTENDFLTTDIQHLERELNEMRKNNDFLISEIAALKNTSKLEPIIETHEDNLAKLETELADCNNMNKNFESEIKRISDELSEVSKEKIQLQESLQDLKQKYTVMLQELETCKNQSQAVEDLENQVSNQHLEKLKKASDAIDDLKKRLSSANAKNEQLSIDVHILENDKVLLAKEVDEFKIAMEEKSSAYKNLETLKLELEYKLQDFENKLEDVLKDKTEYESEKLRLEEKFTDLEKDTLTKSSLSLKEIERLSAENKSLLDKVELQSKENKTLSETIEALTLEIETFKTREQELLDEAVALKGNNNTGNEIHVLENTIEELKAKIVQGDITSKEVLSLKEENKNLSEKNVRIETELSATDSKIVQLEEEFEKVLADINEKDSLIDSLNATAAENSFKLSTMDQQITNLENNITTKNEEIARLKQSLEEINQTLSESNFKSNSNQDELAKLFWEKEEMSKQIFSLNDEISSKNKEISATKKRLEEIEQKCDEYKLTSNEKDKKIKELNQSIIELTDKHKTTENVTLQNDDYAKLVEEKQLIEAEVSQLKTILTVKEKSYEEMLTKSEQLENTILEYKTVLDNATAEKTELINLINLKHNESLQYHNEIQRLNHVILEQNNEFKRVMEHKEKTHNSNDTCSNCEKLRMTLKEKDEIIIKLNQNGSDYDRLKAELTNASETVKNLTEKCDSLDKNMAMQLEVVKKLTAENAQLSEQEQNSTRELERLRHHLMETEENYTQELMASEQKLTECQARLQQVEERAKQTSTVYTSNSIRANQEVETLRNQIKLLEKQREDVQVKLSEAEDARSRSEAALTNLQVVLEQFQLDKERDISAATEKIRNKMEDMNRQNASLQAEITRLNAKLEESLAGLQAATRLGDQVETKTAQINDLKEQVRTLQTSVAAAEERYYNAISNQQDKVDKNLVKNLVINYVVTAPSNSTNKTQVLRVLSTVLDFNQQECEKLGLVRSAAGADSLAAEFVKFLQNESRPRPPLPNMMNITTGTSRSTTPSSRKNSTIGPPPSIPKTGHSRNPSTGSNNLLFQNIENVETASQLSRDSDREPKVVSPSLDTGVNQTRNTEGAILKYVLKDM